MKVKNLTLPFGGNENCNVNNLREANFFQAPYSELDILQLQDLFLIEGFHEIKVVNAHEGRQLVETFLKSLHCYYYPACFTTRQINNGKIINIFYEIKKESIEDFFYNYPQIDFMWIEIFDEQECELKSKNFIEECQSLQIDKKMPILIVRQKR